MSIHRTSFKALFIILFALVIIPQAQAWYYNDDEVNHNGSTEQTAYVISDVENFKLFRDRVNDGTEPDGKYYKLTKDLDLTSETEWEPIGYKIKSSGELMNSTAFSGHFDGDSHTIAVNINKKVRDVSSVGVYAGLFGTVYRAEIKNLNVNGTVTAYAQTTNRGRAEAAGIAIYVIAQATIENCKFSGSVNAVNDGDDGLVYAGGIAADLRNEIKDCEVTKDSTISAKSPTTDINKSSAGGITGYKGSFTTIQGCTSHAKILDALCKGGIAGLAANEGHVLDNVYSGAEWGLGIVHTNSYNGSDEGCTYSPLSVNILTKNLSPTYAVINQRYEAKLEADEVKGVQWEITSGDLPEGLYLGTSGIISGVPTKIETKNFDVQVYVPNFPNIKDTASFTLAVSQSGQNNNNQSNNNNSNGNNNNNNSTNNAGDSGGGGGCNTGLSLFALPIISFTRRKFR